ncbi:gamma-glutamyltransferase [Amphritea balenae]|uniref:Glutathione hydrolase proenzyme n=1 Tax=Amphritea balenae TaxID=452629 RepID=A0A3P1SI49_9GAMM|nr:gamma-glutamyltransferase [Amphritea balenae]RRC96706.1 gamma-glutamyltransferase [Amphritea balenae]GGK84704.1 gamma-glutamyltranspeptidase [Amphritea balenae]
MRYILQSVILGSLLLNPLPLLAVDEDLAPESATGLMRHTPIKADQELVVTAHPLATQAGYSILQQGGSAADAAVAIQAMLTLVEPQSSGLGGGAFMLYWDNVNQQLHAFDGRETAPAYADETLFLKQDGAPMKWWDAMVGGRSVGTPGVLAMLNLSQETFGKLTWNKLFDDTINQAEQGFNVSPRLHQLLASNINPGLGRYPAAKDYFFTAAGDPLPVGHLLKNPQLAQSLRQIAKQGVESFYQGEIASQIVTSVKAAEDNPGKLSIKDMASYQAKLRKPVCMPFRAYRVCGFPPPTSGGVTTLQILKLLERFSNEQLQPGTTSQRQLFTQASRLAYADRARYLADSDFVDVPVKALLDTHYLQQRSQLISTDQDMGKAEAGQPDLVLSRADDRSPELPSTSHFVILDKWGNAVSMTSSIEMAFGSTLMAGGFLLNNQLTDFSFVASQNGKPIANRVEAGKRPRSSMSPIMVFDQNNQLISALGSPGGSRIISYVAESLLVKLTSDISLQQSFELPHVVNRNGTTELEAGTSAEQLAQPLQELGHQIKVRELNSGLHGFYRSSGGPWESAVDPRREGSAMGN